MSLLATLLLAAAAAPTDALAKLAPERPVAAFRARDVDGDGRAELLLAFADGGVGLWRWDAAAGALARGGAELVLPEPDHAALDQADVLGTGREQLIVLDRRGVFAHRLTDGGYADPEPVALTRTGRLGLRLGRPTLVPFVRDVNADGLADLTVPRGATCELWMNAGAGEADAPRFDLLQALPAELIQVHVTRHTNLADELGSDVMVRELDIADVNGDGRPDLRVRSDTERRFHLQGPDGRFADEPIAVDLSIFRDTTPQAEVRPGETLVLSDRARMQSGDLNGDAIPDYVVAHRRKVWSFLASTEGPQFTDSSTRLVAEDVSGLLLVHLDEDDRKDLLIFKVDVPSTVELVLGMVRSISIEVRARGYPTRPDGTFEERAAWRRDLTVRVPSLLRLLREADDLVERFQEVIRKFRWSALGDFDGDGEDDLALVAEDETFVELWRRPAGVAEDRADERWLRQLLFEDPDTVFDVERILKLTARVFDRRTSALTGERAADLRRDLPHREGFYVVDLLAADFDGDGADELVLVEESATEPYRRAFTILPLAGS